MKQCCAHVHVNAVKRLGPGSIEKKICLFKKDEAFLQRLLSGSLWLSTQSKQEQT